MVNYWSNDSPLGFPSFVCQNTFRQIPMGGLGELARSRTFEQIALQMLQPQCPIIGAENVENGGRQGLQRRKRANEVQSPWSQIVQKIPMEMCKCRKTAPRIKNSNYIHGEAVQLLDLETAQ